MNQEHKPSKQWISFRVKPEEYQVIYRHFKATTCRKLSEYARKVLLNKPVVVRYRNQSADNFLQEAVQLKNELNAIGNNFNQVVHKLHMLDTIPEIKTWAILNEAGKKILLDKVEEIRQKMNTIYQLWSQK